MEGPQMQIYTLIQDSLKEPPKTAKDASVLYETLSTQLAMYVASSLSSVEAKLFLAAKLAVQEVEEVSATCFSKTCCCNFASFK